MIALKTADMQSDFEKVSDLVNAGERVLIARPRHDNLVVLSEKEYIELEKAWRNAEYLAKIDAAIERVAQGRVVVKTLEELEDRAQ